MQIAHSRVMGEHQRVISRFLEPGHIIANRYRVRRQLGHGAMGSVYLADDVVLGETEVAVKVLRPEETEDPAAINRFLREVRLTHKIHHQNVVRTFDFGQDAEYIFYTMEYLSGQSLEVAIRQQGLPYRIIADMAAQLIHGLTAVHEVGVIHRDLKPANIIVSEDGTLKITDFGIARAVSAPATMFASDVLGTVRYVAPEVLQGKTATRAVDFYALGVLLYELLTGTSPFNEENPAQLILSKIEQQAVSVAALRPDTPKWLVAGVDGLLERDPERRMSMLQEFSHALDTEVSIEPHKKARSLTRAVTDSNPSRVRKSRSKIAAAFNKGMYTRILWIVACALVVWPLSTTELFSQIELNQADRLFQWRGPLSPDPRVIIISMDEQSYRHFGVPLTAPWPRALHAKLLSRLADAGAKRVVFDVIFAHGSEQNSEDVALAGAMKRVPTVLGAVHGVAHRATINGAFLLEELVEPAPVFEAESIGVGIVGLPQHFGRIRRFPRVNSGVFPTATTISDLAVALDRVDNRRPADTAMINFYGPSKTIPSFPYELVVSDEHDVSLSGLFRDKIVFVGLGLRSSTGASQRDAFITPFDQQTFGVEIHATVASNLLQKDWIEQPSLTWHTWVSFACALFLTAIVAFGTGIVILFRIGGAVAVTVSIQYVLFLLGWFVPITGAALWGIFSGLLLRIVWLQSTSLLGRRSL